MTNPIFMQFFLAVFFVSVIFLHISKKNLTTVLLYGMQSFSIVAFLFMHYFENQEFSLLLIALASLIVKVILAPVFFIRLIKKHALKFSVSTYLSTPFTLIVISALIFMASSGNFAFIAGIVAENQFILSIALASILLSLFLVVNRKGAQSQIVGILSLENSIVLFAIFAGLEQSLGFQMGILFNLSVWILIATIFISMVYKHFGSLNVASMKNLKE